jgi:hypothetical protein
VALLRPHRLSPEFFDLVHEWDPEAANDDYYVTSAGFTELHSDIEAQLLRGLLTWVAITSAAMSVLFAVFHLAA